MQFKLASLVLLAATLTSCAPIDFPHAIQRRDLVGSLGNIVSDLGSIRTNIENTVNSAIGSWNGQAKTTIDGVLNTVDSDLGKVETTLNMLASELDLGCATFETCEADVPGF